jgi:suppressor of tumorigenicity protein 13
MAEAQWTLKIRLVELDRGEVHAKFKNRWDKGETISVQIEPHGTVSMLKQRVALIVAAHEKWQTLKVGEKVLEDASQKLDSIEGVSDGCVIDLYAVAPREKEEDLGELSDDPDAIGEEDEAPPALPEGEAMNKELTEDEEDRQNSLKGAAAELLEDGDKAGALAKLTEAIMVGNPNAMVLAKRGELLLKMKKPKAAILDAVAALSKNPDSVKAYRIRGKAYRLLSKWSEAVEDFAQCQAIDFDDDVADVHKYCTKRKVWHMKMDARKAKEEAKAAAEAA